MKSYKGFDKDLKCKGFQYEIGKSYEQDGEVKACYKGFHACEYPLDCFAYYSPASSRFCEVEQDGEISKDTDDTKVASSKITIGAEINIAGMVEAAVGYTTSRAKKVKGTSCRVNYGAASSTGNYGAASALNPTAIAVAWGFNGRASGVKGAHIVCAEWGEWNGKEYPFIGAKMVQVDGVNIKENTFYTLKNGEFIEASNE